MGSILYFKGGQMSGNPTNEELTSGIFALLE